MAKFKPGDKRPEGAGMKLGQVTKKTALLMDICSEHNFDPAITVIKLIMDKDADLLDKERADLCIKIMDYIYPKRKAIEHTGANGSDFLSSIIGEINGSKQSSDKE